MESGAAVLIRIIVAACLAVIFGNGSVVLFNRTPARWFEDYDEEDIKAGRFDSERRVLPPKLLEADSMGRQRLPSTPWKYAFTGYFAICGIYMAIRGSGLSFEIAAMCVLFIVLLMAISDQLYKVVPDQFCIMLAPSALAFTGFHEKWWEPAAGAALGLGITLSILLIGTLLFGAGSIGGADIKFFACMGLVTGRTGIAIIFILTTLLFAAYSALLIAAGKGSIKDRNAMLPSAAAATTIYFLFLWNIGDLLVLEL